MRKNAKKNNIKRARVEGLEEKRERQKKEEKKRKTDKKVIEKREKKGWKQRLKE